MSFDARDGSRGTRQPGTGPIRRWLTQRVIDRVRRTGKVPGLGFDALVLTTIGRTSGIERSTPVGYFPGREGSWLIVASANGAAKNPAWYHNLAAHPDEVRIETAGRTADVVAEQLHGAEREEAWRQISSSVPRFKKYEEKTDREMPIIRLVERSR